MDDLKKYKEAESQLMHEIFGLELTYEQALERCKQLWELIPSNIDLNPVALNKLMKETYGNHPDFNKHGVTYKIVIGDLKDEDIDEYLKKVVEKIKKPIPNINFDNIDMFNDNYIQNFHDKYGITNSCENFKSSIMANPQQSEHAKNHAIDFAEWLWRNAIHYQRGGTYTFREDDGNVSTYYIEELYDKYLSRPMPVSPKTNELLIPPPVLPKSRRIREGEEPKER
jgi:hypothetical protein